jgi:hypothetical protein
MLRQLFKLESMDFHRSRTTFYSVSSNQSLFGWLYEVTRTEIEILAEPHMKLPVGDESLFQIFGSRHDAFFRATLIDCMPFDTPVDGDTSNLFRFRRIPDIRFENVSRDARRGIHGLVGTFEPKGKEPIEVILQDACNGGVGFLAQIEVPNGTVGTLKATFGDIEITLNLDILQSKALADPTKAKFRFRMGARVDARDRISAAAWRRFNAYGSPEYPI